MAKMRPVSPCTISASPRFRDAARRTCGCAMGDRFMTLLGAGFTLLRFDPAVQVGGLVTAAALRGVPVVVLDVDADDAASLYPQKLVLSRPDVHVAWRGDKLPEDPIGLIDRVRGASQIGQPRPGPRT